MISRTRGIRSGTKLSRWFFAAVAVFLQVPSGFAARPSWPGPSLLAPVRIDSIERSPIWIFPDGDAAKFMLDGAGLVEALSSVVRPEVIEELSRNQVPGSPVVPLAALKSAGIDARFDDRSLEIELLVAPELRLPSAVSLSARPSEGGTQLGPAGFSGYVNLRATEGFATASGGRPSGRTAFLGSVEPVARLGSWVLESGADYAESEAYEWARRDTRLIWDFPSEMVRVIAGDLSDRVSGYQVSRPQAGLSVAREFSIDPYRITHPIGRSEVVLKRPSIVEVYLNGAFFSRMSLPPGPVSLKDFPFVAGVNSVELRITDDLGRTETVALSHVTDFDLLAPGLNQFSYSLGAPSTQEGLDRKYDSERATLTAVHRLGITDRLTAGLSFQGEERTQLAGAEAGLLTGWGFWSGDVAASRSRFAKDGSAFRVFFRSLDRVGETELPARFNLGVENRSPAFLQLGSTAPNNPYGWRLDLYATKALPAALSLGLGYQRQFNRWGGQDRVGARGDLSRSFARTFRAGMNYSWSSADSLQAAEHRVFASLSWSDEVKPLSANLSYDSSSRLARADFSRNPVRPYDDYRLAAGVEGGGGSKAVDAQAEWLAHRGTARLTHRSSSTSSESATSRSTQLNLGTAIAWADGVFAITRPISDAFAIIDVEGRPAGARIPVNSNGEFAQTEANGRGPGVLTDLASYYVQPVVIDDAGLETVHQIESAHFNVRPAYRGGVRVPVRIRSVVHARGTLLAPDGSPLPLRTGEARPIGSLASDAKREPVPFFTNRKGGFMIEGLSAGMYELVIHGGEWKPILADLSHVAGSDARLGDLRLQALEKGAKESDRPQETIESKTDEPEARSREPR